MHLPELMTVLAAAMAPDSTSEQRRAAADLCRTLLLALEASPGQPLAVPAVAAPTVAEAPRDDVPSPAEESQHSAEDHDQEHDQEHDQDPNQTPHDQAAGSHSPPMNAPDSEPPRRTAPFPAPTVRPPAPAIPLTPQNVASFVEAARNLPTETLLDLAISHVRNLVAAKGQEAPTPSAPVRFHLVPLPPTPHGLGTGIGTK